MQEDNYFEKEYRKLLLILEDKELEIDILRKDIKHLEAQVDNLENLMNLYI